MAFRGRGRGRGRGFGGGGGFGIAKQEPYILFPDIELPDVPNDEKIGKEEIELINLNRKLQKFWELSAYYLEDTVTENKQSKDVERYSDRYKPKTRSRRDPLEDLLKLTSQHFPRELIQDSKRVHHRKKVRWNPESDGQKFDLLEKLEQKHGGPDEADGKEKKEGENEEDSDGGPEDEDEEYSDDGDYNQNVEFDDDDDGAFDLDDGNDDEPIY